MKSIEEAKNSNKYTILTNKDSMEELWLNFKKFPNVETSPKIESVVKKFIGGRANLLAFNDTVLEAEFKSANVDPNLVEKVIELFTAEPYMALSLETSNEVVNSIKKSCAHADN